MAVSPGALVEPRHQAAGRGLSTSARARASPCHPGLRWLHRRSICCYRNGATDDRLRRLLGGTKARPRGTVASGRAGAGSDDGVTSALLELECLRTLDRLRLTHPERALELGKARAAVYAIVRTLSVIEVNRAVLERASHPLPVPLGTLDAIHLASALLYREQEAVQLAVATHDVQLALAAGAMGFEVLGA